MPGGTRTPDTRLRRPVLYPTELRTHKPFAIAPADLQLRKRVMGIEPTYLAWKASVLPLNYTRMKKMKDYEIAHLNRGDRIRTCDLLVPNQAL